jgi:hypothetical protein
MELPDDVLGLIREFAKPLPYSKEYYYALSMLGKRKWIVLRDKLISDFKKVYPILMLYLQAVVNTKRVHQLQADLNPSLERKTRWKIQKRLIRQKDLFMTMEQDAFKELVQVLYGPEKLYWDVYDELRNA